MKLSKIYANQLFKNIEFNDGLNVIVGEISARENRDLDNHNIGKSLLLEVIDFLLLKKISNKKKYFLTKHEIFYEYIFYAELKLNSGKYLIIKRSTKQNTKISFKLNDVKLNNFQLDIENWNYDDISIDKSISILNEYLGFSVLKDWKYRKMLNYFMRYQNDYTDVFKLSKFQGIHKDWKPMVFQLLGFNGDIFYKKLELEEQFEEKKKLLKTLETENQLSSEDEDKVTGLLEIKNSEFEALSSEIDKFDFYIQDNKKKDELVYMVEAKIKDLNSEHYTLKYEINKVENSLNHEVDHIDMEDINELYEEVKIYFPNELLMEYNQLLNFNKEITDERNQFLEKNLIELKEKLKKTELSLKSLENEKSILFVDITEKTTYEKFKKYQKDLSRTQADIYILENKLNNINQMTKIQTSINDFESNIKDKIIDLKKELAKQSHKEIRRFFNEFTTKVLNTPAILSIKPNKNNNIEFEAQYQNKKELITTDLAKGFTYKKILCSAFDTSLLKFYRKESFYRFVYHDGVLDSLDIRRKEKYLDYIRTIIKAYDIQYIVTTIESEIDTLKDDYKITEKEICLVLSDESCDGKLFRQCF
jgi:uncharacterized protein YydD (DUF2326 family)